MFEETEIWLPVTGRAEGYPYEVSNKGRVRRSADEKNTYIGKVLKLAEDSYGYLYVCLSKNGITKNFWVHGLVADAFLGPPPGDIGSGSKEWQIDHDDDDKTNNCVENLEWVTGEVNNKKARKAGLVNYYPAILVELIWVLYYRECLAASAIDKVLNLPKGITYNIISGKRRRDITKDLGELSPRVDRGENHGRSKLTEGDVLEIRYLYETGNYTQRELAKMFRVSHSNINAITRRETWKHI